MNNLKEEEQEKELIVTEVEPTIIDSGFDESDDDIFATVNRQPLTTIDIKPVEVISDTVETQKETPKKIKKVASNKGAEMLVSVTDMLVSKICSAISGNDSDNYRLREKERKEQIEVTSAYLEIQEYNVSPTTIFAISTIAIFGTTIFAAFKDKKENDKKAATKTAKIVQIKTEQPETPPTMRVETRGRKPKSATT